MIDIQEYFNKKEQVTQAQESLQKTIQMLVSGFEDNFYFKLNKRATVTSDTLACNVTASFFIPCIKEESDKQKVIEITMVGNLNFNKSHALQLTDFSGFSVNSKKRELTSDRLLLMMHPEIKVTDLPAFEDSTYVIFKGLVKMEKQSFLFQSFEDFCRSMAHFINPAVKDVSVHNQKHHIDYTLTDKEHEYVTKRFMLTFNSVMKSIKTSRNVVKMEDFDEMLVALSDIEKKKFHHSLNTSLEVKPKLSLGKKI